MKISTEIGSSAAIIGEEKAVELIAKAGFDAWDFSMGEMCHYDFPSKSFMKSSHPTAGDNYLGFARKLKKIGEDNGIVCNQSHAPTPTSCPEIRSYFKRAIECTAEAGGEICVIHPDNDKLPEENAEMYFELLPFAKEHNVKIATENMWNWDHKKGHSSFAACATPESFCTHVDAVNDPFLVACLDIGHSEMKGSDTSAVEMIRTLGSRIKAVHLHDNDLWNDSHQIPFSMSIDFNAVIRALCEIHYNGYLTLEAVGYLGAFTETNVFEGIKHLADSAKKLSVMYDKYNCK